MQSGIKRHYFKCFYFLFIFYIFCVFTVCLYQLQNYLMSYLYYFTYLFGHITYVARSRLFLIFGHQNYKQFYFNINSNTKTTTTLEGALKYFFVSVLLPHYLIQDFLYIWCHWNYAYGLYIDVNPNTTYLLLGAGLLICGLFIKLGVAPYIFG